MNYQKPLMILNSQFFKTSSMATLRKSQNPIILNVGVPANSQWLHLADFNIGILHLVTMATTI